MPVAAAIPCRVCGVAIKKAGRCTTCAERIKKTRYNEDDLPPELKAARQREKKQRARDYDQRRGSAASRGYGRAWRRARIVFLRNNLLCTDCKSAGKTTAASVVDHVVPHRGNRTLFWDQDNWQPLCKTHHDQKTRRGE